jgi:aspartyl-tRNA synthetase
MERRPSSLYPTESGRSPLLDQKEFGEMRADAYDVVLNGVEIGGGSIRIHEPELQAKMFEALGVTAEDQQAKFGHLLRAFRLGAPPHGGIALGLDRLVMLICGEESIRQVMAFPKNNRGQELMTQSPADVDPRQLGELGIKLAGRKEAVAAAVSAADCKPRIAQITRINGKQISVYDAGG